MSGALADKSIYVQVVESTEHGYDYCASKRHTINDRHTVQEAVHEEYKHFPMYCWYVEVRREGAAHGTWVWAGTNAPLRELWAGNLYDMVMQNDVVVIMLVHWIPYGPKPRWLPFDVPNDYDLDYHEEAGTKQPGGPRAVGALLQRLGDLR